MAYTELDLQLIKACRQMPLDYGRIQSLIDAGANVNAEADGDPPQRCFEGNMMVSIFNDWPCMSAECDECDKDQDECEVCPLNAKSEAVRLIQLLIDNGLDRKRFGPSMAGRLHYMYCPEEIPAMKLALDADFSDSREEFKKELEGIWTAESFYRCEGEYEASNTCYAEYRIYEALSEGKSICGIDTWLPALGERIEKVCYFGDPKEIRRENGFTAFDAPIGLLCGGRMLVVTDEVHILIDDSMKDQVCAERNGLFGTDVVGRRIEDITFGDQSFLINGCLYRQAEITLTLSGGQKVLIAECFDRQEKKYKASRLYVKWGAAAMDDREAQIQEKLQAMKRWMKKRQEWCEQHYDELILEVTFSDLLYGMLVRHLEEFKYSVVTVYNMLLEIWDISRDEENDDRIIETGRVIASLSVDSADLTDDEYYEYGCRNHWEDLSEWMDTKRTIRIWYSESPKEMCGLLYLCTLLKGYKGKVYAARLPDRIHWNRTWELGKSWADAGFREIQSAIEHPQVLTQGEIKLYAKHWEKLKKENAPLRTVIGGQLISVNEEFFDELILRCIPEKPTSIEKTMESFYKMNINIGSFLYQLRINSLIQAGRIKVIRRCKDPYTSLQKTLIVRT